MRFLLTLQMLFTHLPWPTHELANIILAFLVATHKSAKCYLMFYIFSALQRALGTVSVGKSFGSKGKQHHKHTASETQSHTQWSNQMQRKIMKYLRPGINTSLSNTDLCVPKTACNKVLSVTT